MKKVPYVLLMEMKGEKKKTDSDKWTNLKSSDLDILKVGD